MSINIDIPERKTMIPKISVLGVGGAGGNAINNMINLKLQGVEFLVANTDSQALSNSLADVKLQLGEALTKGLGAGSEPTVGCKAAEESKEDILSHLGDSNMVFITAGMGGGTGTGAAPSIAKICKEHNILTVGVITKPFHFEGSHRMRIAEEGMKEMQKHVDTLIVIPNQNLFHKATEKTTFSEAFDMVDQVLYSGIKGITDLMTMPGLINLDFADIRTIMGGMGKAVMGTGESNGEKRALDAAESAISNPLLDHTSMKGAKGVLINISGGLDMTLFEADEAAQRIKDEVDPDANIIFGSTFDKDLDGSIRVSVVATGIDGSSEIKKPVIIQREENNVAPLGNNTVESEFISNNQSNVNDKPNNIDQFIPPQVVTPQDLSRNENSNSSNSENIVSLEQTKNQKENNLENELNLNLDLEEKQVVGGDNLTNNNYAARNNISEHNYDNRNLNNTQKNIKTPEKKTKKFGGLFNLFNNSSNETENSAPSQNNNLSYNSDIVISESDNKPNHPDQNEDLILSDDMLNVPTFIRNRNDNESK